MVATSQLFWTIAIYLRRNQPKSGNPVELLTAAKSLQSIFKRRHRRRGGTNENLLRTIPFAPAGIVKAPLMNGVLA